MNWSNGLNRLGLLLSLAVLSLIPVETGPSIFEATRGHVAESHERYATEQAHLIGDRAVAPPEALASQVGHAEMMTGGATIAMILCLGMAGWVVAGFRRL